MTVVLISCTSANRRTGRINYLAILSLSQGFLLKLRSIETAVTLFTTGNQNTQNLKKSLK